MSTASAAIAPAAPPPAPHLAVVFGPRLIIGLIGIFVAAMAAGLNNRVGALALADVRGALGFGQDQASWLGTVYLAGELIAMPFTAWFAVTLSLRRFHLMMMASNAVLALLLPLIHSLPLLLALRGLQGLTSGATIPLLMMAALRFLPASIRLHGLALYAMTATFSPNLATWVTGAWTDQLHDWRLVYWQIVPLAVAAMAMVGWGIPQDPSRPERFKQANWAGMPWGAAGLGLIATGLDQGVRLEWFHSPLIQAMLLGGTISTLVYLMTEWHHPAPFIRLQLLARRNLGLGFTLFVGLLIVLLAGSALPASHLAHLWEYRAEQTAQVGLLIALPQLVLGPCVALLLYRSWVDARWMMALGLALLALACLKGSYVTDDWMRGQFLWPQVLQALGQPMAIVSMLFLATSVVHPTEGPFVAGIVNTLRAFGTLLGSALLGQFTAERQRFHGEMLLDHVALSPNGWYGVNTAQLQSIVGEQASVLASADAYRVLGLLALLLIPLALNLRYIPPPSLAPQNNITSKKD